jgi:hypothetical protein
MVRQTGKRDPHTSEEREQEDKKDCAQAKIAQIDITRVLWLNKLWRQESLCRQGKSEG